MSLLILEAQSQSLYIWKPTGGSTSASVAGNWKISTCNGSAATVLPSTTDTILFSNCSSSNAVLDANFDVAFISIKSNYTGTVSQSGSYTLVTEKMKISGGTFTGGSGVITVNGSLNYDGGNFTSTSGVLTVSGNFINTGGNFSHNNGSVKLKNLTSGQLSVGGSSKTTAVTFYDVIFEASVTSGTFRVNNMLLTVTHSVEITGDEELFINGDTILMTGTSNLVLTNSSNTGGGTAEIKFTGSGTQSITGNTTSDYTKLPNLIINKSGTLNLSGNMALGGSSYLHYHSGTISEGTSNFLFYYNDTIRGAMTFHNVEFAGHSGNFYLTDTIDVKNNLTLSGTAYSQVNNGGIELGNNLSYTNSHSSTVLNTTLQFTNLLNDQSITGTFGVKVTRLKIDKGHTLILQNPTTVTDALILKNGYVVSDATNLLILAAGCTVSSASSASFVIGPVKKVGNSSFTFPLGGGITYKPLSISAPSSTTDAFTAEYFNAEQSLGNSLNNLTYVSDCEYWNLTRSVGSSSVKVTLTWDNSSCDINKLTTLKIARWNSSLWTNIGACTTSGTTTSGNIESNSNQSAFGYFAIGKLPLNDALGTDITTNPAREIQNYFGYNGQNIVDEYGWGDEDNTSYSNYDYPDRLESLNPSLIRYPGGSISNWWNWKSGWFRAYDHPSYPLNDDNVDVHDEEPLPVFAAYGMPWDDKTQVPQENTLVDYYPAVIGAATFPMFNLNVMTSNFGDQLQMLSKANCMGFPVKYIELGNEFYLDGPESNAIFPTDETLGGSTAYIDSVNKWSSQLKTYFEPDIPIKIAMVAATKKSDDFRRKTWNDNFATLVGSDVDAFTFHVYNKSGFEIDMNCETPITTELWEKSFGYPFKRFQDLQADEFLLLSETQKEGWITEYNLEDNNMCLRSRWGHALYNAVMGLTFLENELITHVTTQTFAGGKEDGNIFNDNYDLDEGGSNPVANAFEKSGTGHSSQLIMEASKECDQAIQINFLGNATNEVPVVNVELEGDPFEYVQLYGWFFHRQSDDNIRYAIILNLSDTELDVDFENLFPNGGSWETRFGCAGACSTPASDPSSFVVGDTYGADGIENITGTISASDYSIDLKAYSITIIRYRECAQTVSAIATSNNICEGEPVTLYFGGSGDGTYDVTGVGLVSENHLTLTNLNSGTHVITVKDGGSTCDSDNATVTIDVYDPPALSVTASSTLLCASPSPTAVTLTANQSAYPICWNYSNLNGRYGMVETGQTSYLYTTAIGSEVDAYPTYSQTYNAVMNYQGCTCEEESIGISVLFADAGEDVWICDDEYCSTEGPDHVCPTLGVPSAAYPGGSSFSWEVEYEDLSGSTSACSTCLSASNTSNPDFKPTSGPGYYTATITVTKTISGETCIVSDEVRITAITCCNPENVLVLDPFPYPNTYTGGNYPNTIDLFNAVKAEFTSTYVETETGDVGSTVVYDSNDEWGKIKNLTSSQVVINGKLILDKNLYFDNCQNITFGPDTRIEIIKNVILQLDNETVFKACDDWMWEGIIYDNNLMKEEANISPADYMGGFRMISSNIEDAKLGLYTTRDSRFTIIDGSGFDKNYKHVRLEDYRFPYEGEVSGSTFKCTGTMLNPYSLSLRTRYAWELIESDHFGKGQNGNENFTGNTFQECDQAIHSENTGITIYDNYFTDLGTGIYELYFNDHKPTNKIEILDNDFYEVNLGIDLYSNQRAQGFIQGNTIATNGEMPMVGICIIDVMEMGSEILVGGELSGEPNTIASYGWAGIYLVGASNTTVLNNSIVIQTGITVPAYGVRVESASDTVMISKNVISGPTLETLDKAAISFAGSPNNTIHCNTLNHTEIGLEAIGNCFPFITWGNEFKNHEWGFLQGKDIGSGVEGLIGDQPDYDLLTPLNDDFVTGNIFDLSSSRNEDIYSIESNTDPTIYLTQNPNTSAEEPNPGAIGNLGGFPITLVSDDEKEIYECEDPIPNFTDVINVELSEGVIDEDISFGYYNEEIAWNYLLRLYSLLKAFPEFLERSETLEDFYNESASNNIGKFYKVDSLIQLLNDSVPNSSLLNIRRTGAIAVNNSITTANDMEENLKKVNDIFLHSVAENKFVLSSTQVSDLTAIANQCPYIDGKAVFRARGMLALTSLGTYYDDAALCGVTPKLNNQTESGFLKAFPNPSSGIVAIAWSTLDGSDCLLRVMDINGKIVGSFKLEQITGMTWCNFSSMPSGTYFIELLTAIETYHSKLVIARP